MSDDGNLHPIPMEVGLADELLRQILAQFGVTKYALVVVGEALCEHGTCRIEMHSSGMERAEIKETLIDAAAMAVRGLPE